MSDKTIQCRRYIKHYIKFELEQKEYLQILPKRKKLRITKNTYLNSKKKKNV